MFHFRAHFLNSCCYIFFIRIVNFSFNKKKKRKKIQYLPHTRARSSLYRLYMCILVYYVQSANSETRVTKKKFVHMNHGFLTDIEIHILVSSLLYIGSLSGLDIDRLRYIGVRALLPMKQKQIFTYTSPSCVYTICFIKMQGWELTS